MCSLGIVVDEISFYRMVVLLSRGGNFGLRGETVEMGVIKGSFISVA